MQALATVRFDPEIIVIAGKASEPGGRELLQKDFPLTYTVANSTILDRSGEPLGNISMEEPFNSHPVRNLNRLYCLFVCFCDLNLVWGV